MPEDITLLATTNLVAANAEHRIFQAMGLGRGFNHGVFQGCTTSNNTEAKELTLRDIEQAIELLTSCEKEAQEGLIRLLTSIGFRAGLNPYCDEPLVLFPKEYEEAFKSVAEQRKQKEQDVTK